MSWPTVNLGSIAQKIDYGVTASAIEKDDGPRFLRITDLQDDSVNWNTVPSCECSEKELECNLLEEGDIVFARTGATTGKSYLIRNLLKPTVFASYLIRVKPSDKVDSLFLSYFFKSPNYWLQINNMANGAAQPGVNSTKLKELKIPLPPLAEQKRIAAIIDKADAIRRKRQQAIQLADQFLRSVFLDMFGDPVTNPKGWEVNACSNVSNQITVGLVIKPASYYVERGVPAIRSLNIKDTGIDESNFVFFSQEDNENKLSKSRVYKGDLVIVRSGQPGKAAVIPTSLDGVNAIDVLILRPNQSIINSEYLAYFFNSGAAKQIVLSEQRGQIQKHLNVGSLNSAMIPVPPIQLQNKFVSILEKVRSNFYVQEKGFNTELFRSLSQKAFAGEL